jgi:hypothetical protein
VNIKIDVQRVALNLRKSGLSAAYRTRVCWLEHGAAHPDTHAVSLASMFGSVQLGQPINKKTEHTQRERTKIPAIATTAGVLYARTHTHSHTGACGRDQKSVRHW